MTTTVSPIPPRSGDDLTFHDGSAVSLRERALAGESAWSREARITLALAAEAGVALDDETLFACDVRICRRSSTPCSTPSVAHPPIAVLAVIDIAPSERQGDAAHLPSRI